jgi:hypothetical protein
LVDINPHAQDLRASIFADSSAVPLAEGQHFLRSVSMAGVAIVLDVKNHGHERIYHFSVRRDALAGPHLSGFMTTPNNWTPSFNPDSLSYALTTSAVSLAFDSIVDINGSTLFFNGSSQAMTAMPPPLSLSLGLNAFTVKLDDGNGGWQFYQFIVTRQ